MHNDPADRAIAIVYGGGDMGRQNSETDYKNSAVKAPACLIMMKGGDYRHGSGPWDGTADPAARFKLHPRRREHQKS